MTTPHVVEPTSTEPISPPPQFTDKAPFDSLVPLPAEQPPLPPAAPDDEIPSYEEVADAIPLPGLAGELPTSTFTCQTKEKSKDVVLRLFEQKDETMTDVPAYGRGSVVKGEIGVLKKMKGIRSVSIKLEGKTRFDIFDGYPAKRVFLNVEKDLWSKSGSGESTPPDSMPFELQIPQDEECDHPLPPSYVTLNDDIAGLSGKIIYRLLVTIELKTLTTKKKTTLSQDVMYFPRSAPPEALIQNWQDFSTSDNWFKISREVKTNPRAPPETKPLTANFFIPNSRVFGVSQTIPFHVQLTGGSPEIDEFLPPAEDSAAAADGKAKKEIFQSKKWVMKVQVMRQTIVTPPAEGKGHEKNPVKREVVIGDAVVRPMASSSPSEGKWEFGGEVRCFSAVKTGAINLDGLAEKDYVVLHIQPTNKSLVGRRCAIPIRLVTDSNVDDTTTIIEYPMKDRIKGALIAGMLYGCVVS